MKEAEFIAKIKKSLKGKKHSVVLPESSDKRILEASQMLIKSGITPILIGDAKEILQQAKKHKIKIKEAIIINNLISSKKAKYAKQLVEIRKKRNEILTLEQALDLLKTNMYFALMMLYNNESDAVVAGAKYTTPEVLKPAFKIIGTDSHASGAFFMLSKNKDYLFADCAVTPEPNAKELAETAVTSAETYFKLTGKQPYVAMLSFSTNELQNKTADKIRDAVRIAKIINPKMIIDGEMQLDAAIVSEVGKSKFPQSKVAGKANVLVFPDLNSGNIGYKLVERFAGATAIGPLIQGIRKPVSDLSRGCSSKDVFETILITLYLSQKKKLA
jgi:phosphate acetyltransferase